MKSRILKLKLKLKYALCNAASMQVTVGLQGKNRVNFKTRDRPPCATNIVAHQNFLAPQNRTTLHTMHSSQMLSESSPIAVPAA